MQQQVVEHAVASLAKHLENQVDAEIHKLDNLNDDDIDAIRKKRMLALKKRQENMKEWAAKGHGEYTEVATEKDFFAAMKGEERVVCHFYRENWPCKVLGLCLVCVHLRGGGACLVFMVVFLGHRCAEPSLCIPPSR